MNTQLDVAAIEADLSPKRGRIVAIASGKGGVGKTSLTLNLARALSKTGKKVLVVDADLGLANVDVQLGITPNGDLSEVVRGTAKLADVVSKTDKGFDVIAGRSGSETLPFTTALDRHEILQQVTTLAQKYDVVFLDVAAGVSDEVLIFSRFADRTALVVTPDPSSITDAYAVIKLLKIRHDTANAAVIVNQAGTELDGRETYEKIRIAAEKFLHLKVPMLGVMPYDRNYLHAVRTQQLLVDIFPQTKTAAQATTLAKSLLD